MTRRAPPPLCLSHVLGHGRRARIVDARFSPGERTGGGVAPGAVAAEAVTTVTVDPASASFTVQHTYRLSNTASDETFTGFFEIFPPTALDVTASVGGVSTTAVSVPVSAGFAEWFVPFPEALTPDSSPVDVVRWRASGLTGDPNAFDRVSEGVVSIAPYAVGRGAEAELIVEIPGDYDVVVADGYDLTRTTPDSSAPHRSIEEQYVALPVVVEAPDQYVRRPIDGPIDVTVATPTARATGWGTTSASWWRNWRAGCRSIVPRRSSSVRATRAAPTSVGPKRGPSSCHSTPAGGCVAGDRDRLVDPLPFSRSRPSHRLRRCSGRPDFDFPGRGGVATLWPVGHRHDRPGVGERR